MGTDIHMRLEYRREAPDGYVEYRAVIAHFYSSRRDYRLFGMLAAVRGGYEAPVLPLRGVPSDASEEIWHAYYYQVVPDDPPPAFYAFAPETTTERRAAAVTNGRIVERWGYRYVKQSDWHSASYLSLAELRHVLAAEEYPEAELLPEYQLIIRILSAVDELFGEGSARMVFWFDN